MIDLKKLKFITIEDLLEMEANEQDYKLIEIQSEEKYKEGHIPGALNIPWNDLETKAPELLNKKDLIVTYCAGYSCHASTNAAIKLTEMGYKNVLDYKGGKRGWLHAGLKLVKE
jgi:rhodanese-related sulfurtransferase